MMKQAAGKTMTRRAHRANRLGVGSVAVRWLSTTTLNYPVIPKEDFGAFKEYSVIHTDRSLNLMSDPFQRVMRDLNQLLKTTYNADKVIIIPGSGTFGMEAVARQFATDEHVMVVRNGWFSYRWTEIFDMGGDSGRIPKSHTVLKAQPLPPPQGGEGPCQYQPHPIDEVLAKIEEERPAVFFCPHVETSTGMILPDDYLRRIASKMHDIGGLLVVDCIASGTVWIDMKDVGVDVLISAPQKGWTGPPCAALVQLSERAHEKMQSKQETSFSMSLKRWAAIMDAYENGGFAYHTTMPTDALRDFHEISVETLKFGLPELKQAQLEMGAQARSTMDAHGLLSVAAPGFQAPGVLVYYSPEGTENPVMMQEFKQEGLQIAMGVPWKIDEPEGLKTFRIGLFGLDKLGNIQRTVSMMESALDNVLSSVGDSSSEVA
mmetsp:Transcript_4289/g.9042  ORF Transcript_4289/g.9042 Transcript_4289/m.9042 type:complete len:432 (-) Transcript_4289:147-1442(-)|eukprot:CAMPEP_0168739518 /NCGR_PEP_ID=MMETSP0724-20121128/11505_1 /TAXON_ID=265536 /ORGANISM="Amphiprora sp., Strain CCMP467" /LENGTH=431 /DNA_ID=CAMNT_0008786925 /DNA_START=60 /DNA_END=1355 /DNA_ORIENTATION=+